MSRSATGQEVESAIRKLGFGDDVTWVDQSRERITGLVDYLAGRTSEAPAAAIVEEHAADIRARAGGVDAKHSGTGKTARLERGRNQATPSQD
eukprot:scaffold2225_cov169-Pinguiococcus_pyrenoidosus.AAC.1